MRLAGLQRRFQPYYLCDRYKEDKKHGAVVVVLVSLKHVLFIARLYAQQTTLPNQKI